MYTPDDDKRFWTRERTARWKGHRAKFLRQLHRAPLEQRIADVFGPYAGDAISLIKKLPREEYDASIRDKLRAAKRAIPIPDYGRRWKYFVRCVEGFGVMDEKKKAVLEAAVEAQEALDLMDEDDYRLEGKAGLKDLHRKIAKGKIAEGRSFKRPPIEKLRDMIGAAAADRLVNSLMGALVVRDAFDEQAAEQAAARFYQILANALTKRYPRRYLVAVIKNEKQHAMRRCRR